MLRLRTHTGCALRTHGKGGLQPGTSASVSQALAVLGMFLGLLLVSGEDTFEQNLPTSSSDLGNVLYKTAKTTIISVQNSFRVKS